MIGPVDGGSPAQVTRLLAANAALAMTALLAMFGALLGGDAEQNAAVLVLGGLALVPSLWVFSTSVAALRKPEIDAHTLLERQALLVILTVVGLVLARVGWLFGARVEDPGRIHYLFGAQTLLVYYSARVHAATRRPPSSRLHPTATAGVVLSCVIELGVAVRLIASAL